MRRCDVSLVHAYNGLDDRVATTTTLAGGNVDTRRFVHAPDGRVLGEYGSDASDVRAEFIWASPEVGAGSAFVIPGTVYLIKNSADGIKFRGH